jgi:hypothetical protein
MTCRSAIVGLALAACSGDHHHGVDAPPVDVATDTLPPSTGDPPPTAVALYVTALGVPAPDVAVYFQKPDSTVELGAITDSRGLAWALASAGDFVTTIEPPNASGMTAITTFAGVQPGDRLHLDLLPQHAAPQVALTLQVPAHAGAANYIVYNACGDPVFLDATATGSVGLVDCGAGLADLVITPVDASGAQSLGALFAPGVVIAEGGTTSVAGSYASFDMTTFTYSSVPASVVGVNTYQAIVTPRGRVFDATSQTVAPTTGSAITSIAEPHTPNGTIALTVTQEWPQDSELSQQAVYSLQPWGAAYTADLATARLPEVSTMPAFQADTATITWTERTGGMSPSLVRASVRIFRDAIPAGRAWQWRIAAPRTGASTTLPHLPLAGGFDFNPMAGDSFTVEDLTTALVPGGYDAVRAHAFAELVNVMASGTMIVEVPYSPPL